MTIKSFKCSDTELLFRKFRVKRLASIEIVGRRKLAMLDFATRLDDLRSPPRNRLEALKSSRTGEHSICVNDQFRVCFVWTGQDAENVEIVDYH